jgi:flagellar basal body L-ring protein FlgH
MKHIAALLLLLLGLCSQLQAQQNSTAKSGATDPTHDALAREATEKLVAKYSLNADQAKQMYRIQLRKLRNNADIAGLKASDPARYQAKVKSVQKGTLASIRRILQTKEQVDIFQKTQSDVRGKKSEKRKALMLQNASSAETEAAMLDIYAE